MTMSFHRATKAAARLRMAIIGPAGGGKTYTALTLAAALGKRVAVIDTERGSASKYSDIFTFDALELATFAPQTYVEAIHIAEKEGYDVLVIDSLSHAWMGREGALEQVDRAAARSQSKNSFGAWREVTPHHNALVDAMLQSPMHIVVTMRTKTEYLIEKDDRGKSVPRKVGLAPIQRDGLEYEFDVVGEFVDQELNLSISKTRCSALRGQVIQKPGAALAATLSEWLVGAPGSPLPAPMPPAPTPNEDPVIGEQWLVGLRDLAARKGRGLREFTGPHLTEHQQIEALRMSAARAIRAELEKLPDRTPPPNGATVAGADPMNRWRDIAPVDYVELSAFVGDLEAKLVREGRCTAGELRQHVVHAAAQGGLPDDWSKWTPGTVATAVDVAREFAAAHPKAAAPAS